MPRALMSGISEIDSRIVRRYIVMLQETEFRCLSGKRAGLYERE